MSLMEPSEADWKRTLYASVVAQFCCMVGFSFGFPFMPFYLHDLGVQYPLEVRKWAGLVSSAAGFTMAVFAPIWGAVADKYGRKIMVLRSMFGAGAIMALMACAQRPEHLLILRFIQGMLTGTITANVAMVAGITPRERSGYALGLLYGAAYAGNAIGPAIGGFVAEHFKYRVSFAIGACFLVTAGLLIKFLTRDVRPERTEG